MNTYELILQVLATKVDFKTSALRINVSDFSLPEAFVLTLTDTPKGISAQYVSDEITYSYLLDKMPLCLQEEILLLLLESMKEDIQVISLSQLEEERMKFEEQLAKIKENPFSIAEIENPSEALIFEAAKINGFIIQYFEKVSERTALAAVMQNGLSLEFINTDDQTTALCVAAVRENSLALSFVEEQDHEICDTAIRRGMIQVQNGELSQEKYEFEVLNMCEY